MDLISFAHRFTTQQYLKQHQTVQINVYRILSTEIILNHAHCQH